MKALSVLLLAICFFASKSSYSQNSLNPNLKDSSMHNWGAYMKKFYSQVRLKHNDSAIITGKQIIKLKPKNALITYEIGELYEKTGDTVTSIEYYKRALVILNTVLDTMNVKSVNYNFLRLNKAVVLILLGQEKAGDDILRDSYNNETLYSNKQYDLSLLHMTRKELIYGKAHK
jgi:tetratricopeptide (TPR) repeat protein